MNGKGKHFFHISMHIHHLSLYTQQLSAQRDFYHQKLGLPLLEAAPDSFQVQAGATILQFKQADPGVDCFYHFAFNIPSNQYRAVPDWLAARSEVLLYEGQPIVRFENWDAHATYFMDVDRNILELVARHTLQQKLEGPFSSSMILNISEIGHPVDNPQTTATQLMARFDVKRYSFNNDVFCPVGDPNGLIILTKIGRNWVPTDRPAIVSPFEVTFEIGGKERTKKVILND